MPTANTLRSEAKANRRRALLDAAATLFAKRGYNGVSIEELGSSAGVSGPAVYRHFSGKQAVLAALLIGVSRDLLDGGSSVVALAENSRAALRALVAFHVEFALGNADVIEVQDRDLASLTDRDRRLVRTLQRHYVELWVTVLETIHPDSEPAELRIRAHATFGLINSTPRIPRSGVTKDSVHGILERAALAVLEEQGAQPSSSHHREHDPGLRENAADIGEET